MSYQSSTETNITVGQRDTEQRAYSIVREEGLPLGGAAPLHAFNSETNFPMDRGSFKDTCLWCAVAARGRVVGEDRGLAKHAELDALGASAFIYAAVGAGSVGDEARGAETHPGGCSSSAEPMVLRPVVKSTDQVRTIGARK